MYMCVCVYMYECIMYMCMCVSLTHISLLLVHEHACMSGYIIRLLSGDIVL